MNRVCFSCNQDPTITARSSQYTPDQSYLCTIPLRSSVFHLVSKYLVRLLLRALIVRGQWGTTGYNDAVIWHSPPRVSGLDRRAGKQMATQFYATGFKG